MSMNIKYGSAYPLADNPIYLRTMRGDIHVLAASTNRSSTILGEINDQFFAEAGEGSDEMLQTWLDNDQLNDTPNVFFVPALNKLVLTNDIAHINYLFDHVGELPSRVNDSTEWSLGINSASWDANIAMLSEKAYDRQVSNFGSGTILGVLIPGAQSAAKMFTSSNVNAYGYSYSWAAKSLVKPLTEYKPSSMVLIGGIGSSYSSNSCLQNVRTFYQGGNPSTKDYFAFHDVRQSVPNGMASYATCMMGCYQGTSGLPYYGQRPVGFWKRTQVKQAFPIVEGSSDLWGISGASGASGITPWSEDVYSGLYAAAFTDEVKNHEHIKPLLDFGIEYSQDTFVAQLKQTMNYGASAIPIGKIPQLALAGESVIAINITSIAPDDEGGLMITTAGMNRALMDSSGLKKHVATLQTEMDDEAKDNYNKVLDTVDFISYQRITRVSDSLGESKVMAAFSDVGISASDLTFDGGDITGVAKVADKFTSTNSKNAPLLIPFSYSVTQDDFDVSLVLLNDGQFEVYKDGVLKKTSDYAAYYYTAARIYVTDSSSDGSWTGLDARKVAYEEATSATASYEKLSPDNPLLKGWDFENASLLPDSCVADKQITESMIPYTMRSQIMTFGCDYTLMALLTSTTK